jgi:hypothetical protein
VAEIELALQAAYVARLKGAAPVSALVGSKVYDRAPQEGALWPHIEVGEMQVIEDAANCQDVAADQLAAVQAKLARAETEMPATLARKGSLMRATDVTSTVYWPSRWKGSRTTPATAGE